MGFLFSKQKKPEKVTKSKAPQIEDIDIVKIKLKQARDKIKNFIASKDRDIERINVQIKQKLPAYQQTKNKKALVPLLKAKKDLQTMIDNADVRLKLVNEKLSEVELKQMDKDTVNVLDDSNKYIQKINQELEAKDWQNVLQEAKHKYELQWPDDSQEIQQDPAFQEMWKELGGEKLQAKKSNKQKIVEKKEVHVNIQHNNQSAKNTHKQQQMLA